jgi:SOS response regulatory protein OraA/RecX
VTVPNDATIMAIRVDPKDPNLRIVAVHDQPDRTLLARDAESLGLTSGMRWTEELASEIEHFSAIAKARNASLGLLSRRPWGTAELRRRLEQRGFARDVAAVVVTALVDDGWMDDQAFAQALCRSWLKRSPAGSRWLLHKLAEKGVHRELAESVVEELLAGTDQQAEADRLAKDRLRKMASVPEEKARQRVAAALRRRGFDAETTRAAIDAAFG